jgi:hypothetical protein
VIVDAVFGYAGDPNRSEEMVMSCVESEPLEPKKVNVSARFRGRALPRGMSLAVAIEAERLISEWSYSSDQPDQLASVLFRLFVGPAN